MRMIRAVVVAALAASAWLGAAGPAQADQLMEGVYSYTQGDVSAEWTIWPSCVPTVGDLRDNLELPVACRLHISPSSPVVSGGDARLTGGRWAFTTTKKEGIQCSDGSWATVIENYFIDDITMSGTRQVTFNDACDNQVAASVLSYPFTLALKEPLPIPVDKYPLYCEPGGLKRCF